MENEDLVELSCFNEAFVPGQRASLERAVAEKMQGELKSDKEEEPDLSNQFQHPGAHFVAGLSEDDNARLKNILIKNK